MKEQENTKVVHMKEFKDAIDVVDNYNAYLTCSELLKIIKNHKLAKNGGILDNKDSKLEKIIIDNAEYSFKTESDSSGHRFGDGGEWSSYHFLQRNKEDVLVSMKFDWYATSGDDFFELGGGIRRRTYLLKEDKLARAVFEEIKKRRIIKYFWSTKESFAHILKTTNAYIGLCGKEIRPWWNGPDVRVELGTLQEAIKAKKAICEECARKYK